MLFLCSIIANRWGLREAKNRIKMIDISIEKKRIIKQLSTLPLIAIGFFMSSCYSGNGLDESRIDEEDIVDEDGSPDYAQFTWDEVQQFRDYLDTLDRKFQEIEENL